MKDKYLLALNSHPSIGSQTIKKILAAFNDLEKLWHLEEAKIYRGIDEKIAKLIIEAKAQFDPQEELEKLRRLNIGYITKYDKSYPALLSELHDAPVVLYIRGELEVLNKQGIAVVGSRNYSSYGQLAAKKLVPECVANNLSIISGLALGIDGIVHRTTLDNKGQTIAVLACGLDKVYPASHLGLAHQIINSGGAIVSEYPPGTAALKYNFPARNRIIAGLALGTLVIEANEKSGALITALQALEYNREVFAVPGNINSSYSLGTNKLIQQGAKLVMSGQDIFEELNIDLKQSQIEARKYLPENEDEKKIIDILARGECYVDIIVQESGLNVISINSALTMLEMKGIIKNIGGGRYGKVY